MVHCGLGHSVSESSPPRRVAAFIVIAPTAVFTAAAAAAAATLVDHTIDVGGCTAGRGGARYNTSPSRERAHGSGGSDAGGAKKGSGAPAPVPVPVPAPETAVNRPAGRAYSAAAYLAEENGADEDVDDDEDEAC